MIYFIILILIIAALYVGYAYGQEFINWINDTIERVRALYKSIKNCFGK